MEMNREQQMTGTESAEEYQPLHWHICLPTCSLLSLKTQEVIVALKSKLFVPNFKNSHQGVCEMFTDRQPENHCVYSCWQHVLYPTGHSPFCRHTGYPAEHALSLPDQWSRLE